jgi:hypothetical protein
MTIAAGLGTAALALSGLGAALFFKGGNGGAGDGEVGAELMEMAPENPVYANPVKIFENPLYNPVLAGS